MGELHLKNNQKIDNKYSAVKMSRLLLGKNNRAGQIQLSRQSQSTRDTWVAPSRVSNSLRVLRDACISPFFFLFLLLAVGTVRCSRGDYASSCSYVWDYTMSTSGGLCVITFAKCPQISSLHIHEA